LLTPRAEGTVRGDDIANELVNWFNQVDATYRNDLRELNELNFARFDAKLEQRVAQFDAKLAAREGRLLARIGVLEGSLIGRIGMVEGRLTRLTVLLWATLLATLVGLLRLL
jgi:hypothetical protein